jgi:Tfp pilus assembly protein PilN
VADTVPQDLWLTALEEKDGRLRLGGVAFSSSAVADFMTNLKRSGTFKEVDIVVSRQDLTKRPRVVTFEITCEIAI